MNSPIAHTLLVLGSVVGPARLELALSDFKKVQRALSGLNDCNATDKEQTSFSVLGHVVELRGA